MKHTLTYLIYSTLAIIVVFGFFLRIYKVTQVPPSLSWDEVSIGYNAYSILKTGKDEHGKFLPLDTFVSYGDYKPPLAIYATVPSVALFGLNDFSVRLPSVIFGTLTILVAFFLVEELFGGVKVLSLLTSVLLCLSPWHIQLSRAGFEGNIAVFFVCLGVWLVLAARKKPRLLLVSWIPFVASMYTFNSARYFSPLFGLGLLWYIKPLIVKQKKLFIGGVVIAFLCLTPLIPHLLSKEARLRYTEVNIFSDLGIVATANARIAYDHHSIVANILDNRRVGYIRSYLMHFFDNLEPKFLFIKGDGNPKFSIQDVGELYPIELPFLLIGIYFIFTEYSATGWLLLFWLLMAIVPAAVARETPHALRIENSLPTWQIFIAGGIYWCLTKVKNWKYTLFVVIIALEYGFNFSYYIFNYYIHYPVEFSGEWQFGYREAIRYAEIVKNSYDSIVMTDAIGRPYMYTLFYTAYDPNLYRRTVHGSFDAAGFYNVSGFDTYHFVRGGQTDFYKKTLYILSPGDVPQTAHVLKTIYLLNGQPTLVIFDI